MATATRSELTLDYCRSALDRVIQARATEDWEHEPQMDRIRHDAVVGAIEDGWPIESVSEASGVPVAEIHELLDRRNS